MFSTSRLRVFREVIAHGSFSAAADALSYSQSAVSQAIATLEGEAGVALIERTRSGALPTAAGAALAAQADGILAQIEAAESEVAAIASGHGGRLRVASFPTAGATLMPAAIAAFRASHPGVELSLAEGEPEEIAPRLRAGEFDLVLLFEFPGAGERLGAGMRRFALLDDPLHLALPHDHRLAGRSRLRLEDLAEDSWVQTSATSPCARHVVRACHRAGFDPRVSFESDDYQTVQGLVAAGVGVALIPQLALSSVRSDVLVRPLDPRPPVRKVFAATPRAAAATPAVATMLSVLREAGGQAVPETAAA
jgi:DNA-binding transcriptional LysR family regulator